MVTTQRKPKQLGQILLEQGLISEEHLQRALEEHRNTPKSLGRVLIDLGYIRERDLVRALAEQVGLEFVDLTEYRIDAAATALLPEALCRRYRALPIGEVDGKLLVAMSDPANVYALDDIRTITGRDVRPVVATSNDVEQAIAKYSGMGEQVEALASEAADALDTEADLTRVEAAVEDAPIVKLVQAIMTQAAADRASDVHIEPTEIDVRVRFRVDGVLHEVMHSPKSIQGGLISRLKVMGDLNIAEKRIPQDGRVSLRVNNRSLDLRLATLPTVHGEKIVIRILDKTNALLQLSELGFLPQAFESYERSFRKPYGAILVTGPTGSGKSTTLYATLNIVNSIDRHIVTVEDPVEYRLPGVNQIQVNPKAGLTFASALRSILRADPDIILIGEIRDRETAMIAVESALTGHLVLSSLHTNDAPSAITRLIEMQVETFLVGSAIDCVVAQRLARQLCEKCKQAYTPEESELIEAGFAESRIPDLGVFFRPSGCQSCSNTGYRGRIGLYEVMPMTEEIERLTVERASSETVKRVAIEQGHVHAARRRAPQGRDGPDLHRRDRKGGEVMSSDGQEAEVQIPIPELLEAMVERGASDLHLTVGTPPTIRQYGDLVRLDEYPVLDKRGIQGMIYAILPQKMRERLEQELELDMSYSLPGRARFRVNVYYQRDSLGAAFRLIPYEIRTVEELDLPSVVADLARYSTRVRRRHGADRFGQVHDLGLDGRHREPRAAGAHHDRRGPDRVPPQAQELRREPAGGRGRHALVRAGPQARPASGPRRHPRRRDA